MNKLLFILASILMPFIVCAQELKGTHEIELSGGSGSPADLGISMNSFLSGFDANSEADQWQLKGESIYFLTYKYFIGNTSAIGISAGVQSITVNISNDYNYFNGNFTSTRHVLAFEFTQHYFVARRWMFYGFCGVGSYFNKTSYSYDPQQNPGRTISNDNGDFFAFQLTPFAMRYGRNFGAFCEIGYGYKGIINLGLSFKTGKFSNKKNAKKSRYDWSKM